MMPVLAVLLAPHIISSVRAAGVLAVVVTILGAGICIFVVRNGQAMAPPMVAWAAAAIVIAATAAFVSSRFRRAWVPAALGSILAAQALMMAYASFPPAQSSKALLADARQFIGPRTEIFSVNQYRQSVPPYLGRKVRLVGYEGELGFGIQHDRGNDFIPSLHAFANIWMHSTDAVAFVDPGTMAAVKALKIPFRLRAFDGKSFVITRS
jgi:hypothetical protein